MWCSSDSSHCCAEQINTPKTSCYITEISTLITPLTVDGYERPEWELSAVIKTVMISAARGCVSNLYMVPLADQQLMSFKCLLFIFQGRCSRENCKYLHPPSHLKTQLEINGRNNLIQQKTAAAVLAQQMQLVIPGPSLQSVVSRQYRFLDCGSVCLVVLCCETFLSNRASLQILVLVMGHIFHR